MPLGLQSFSSRFAELVFQLNAYTKHLTENMLLALTDVHSSRAAMQVEHIIGASLEAVPQDPFYTSLR